MPERDSSRVRRQDAEGREHTVRVQRTGARRVIECDTCGWRQQAQFLPWLKAEEHLAQEHRATVDAAKEVAREPAQGPARESAAEQKGS